MKKTLAFSALFIVFNYLNIHALELDGTKEFVIRVPAKDNAAAKYAARELAKHLKLVFDQESKIVKMGDNDTDGLFFVGIVPKGEDTDFAPEEGRYLVTDDKIYFYGDDDVSSEGKDDLSTILSYVNRVGTLFAVYEFLENELGVHWINPGDDYVNYAKREEMDIRPGLRTWKPAFDARAFWRGIFKRKNTQKIMDEIPEGYRWNEKELDALENDVLVWLRRMRMGASKTYRYGHAFRTWWERYGKDHPEWFALKPDGTRGPTHESHPERVKMCVTNPDLLKQIVSEWLKRRRENPNVKVINACENDSAGYCCCEQCSALDMPKKGESFQEHMTDRYVYFANAVLEEARKHAPDAQVSMYAYSRYRFPPRKEKVLPGVVIAFVPSGSPKQVDEIYAAWRKAGATTIILRPNDMHANMGLPWGDGKEMFDRFKVGLKYGVVATSYDSLHGFWPYCGLGDYALAKAHVDPEKPFEHWEDEYCDAYGAAGGDVKKYYKYWRDFHTKQVDPHSEAIVEVGINGNFRRGLFRTIGTYFLDINFDESDAILAAGLENVADGPAKRRLERLILANKHARLMVAAQKGVNMLSSEKFRDSTVFKDCVKAVQKLVDFRSKHRDDLNIFWPSLAGLEAKLSANAGIKMLKIFDGAEPVSRTPIYWHFKIDEDDVGLKENWQESTIGEVRAWPKIRTDRIWEKQVKIDEKLQKALSSYDGFGWYGLILDTGATPELTGKKAFLVFGAVDESCWVYVNGKEAGSHVFKDPDDWKAPFKIRIDPCFDNAKDKQVIVIRVQDENGAGGIYKAVWLATEPE